MLVVDRHTARSLRSRVLNAATKRAVIRALTRLERDFGPETFDRLRRLDEFAARRARPVRGTRTEPVTLADGVRAEWVHGPGVPAARDRAILYLHGGGWVTCGLNTHRQLIARISAASGVPALAVDYRMFPAVSFGQEAEDCLAGYRWLLDSGAAAEHVTIMGDSAGGHLTFATALLARDRGLPLPAGLVGISGCYDLDLATKRSHANARLAPVEMRALERLVGAITEGLDVADPSVSPLRADLAGLPPALLTASYSEVLYDDSERLAHRLDAAGVPCMLRTYDQQLHVFQAFGMLLPEARASVTAIGAWVRGNSPGQAG